MIQLNPAKLVKRYKRFLADVFINNELKTIYVPNTGAMTNCGSEGDRIWYSNSENQKRKYQQTWEITEYDGHLICVNTARANQFVGDALRADQIPSLSGYQVKPEVKFGDSRIDFLLTHDDQHCFVEVKSCTLLENNQGYFPDAVTKRGQKHLLELIKIVEQGHRAVLLFAILHSGINSVKAAKHIDKQYAELLEQAIAAGVEVLTYKPDLTQLFQLQES